MSTFETERGKARTAQMEAMEYFSHAMELLGRDNNTEHFCELIRKRNAALWRWKRAVGTAPASSLVRTEYYN